MVNHHSFSYQNFLLYTLHFTRQLLVRLKISILSHVSSLSTELTSLTIWSFSKEQGILSYSFSQKDFIRYYGTFVF